MQTIELFSVKTVYFHFMRWAKLNVATLFRANVLLFFQILSILRTLQTNFICQQIHDSTVLLMNFVSLESVPLFPNTLKIYCEMQFYFIFSRTDADNSVSINFKKNIYSHFTDTYEMNSLPRILIHKNISTLLKERERKKWHLCKVNWNEKRATKSGWT